MLCSKGFKKRTSQNQVSLDMFSSPILSRLQKHFTGGRVAYSQPSSPAHLKLSPLSDDASALYGVCYLV